MELFVFLFLTDHFYCIIYYSPFFMNLCNHCLFLIPLKLTFLRSYIHIRCYYWVNYCYYLNLCCYNYDNYCYCYNYCCIYYYSYFYCNYYFDQFNNYYFNPFNNYYYYQHNFICFCQVLKKLFYNFFWGQHSYYHSRLSLLPDSFLLFISILEINFSLKA